MCRRIPSPSATHFPAQDNAKVLLFYLLLNQVSRVVLENTVGRARNSGVIRGEGAGVCNGSQNRKYEQSTYSVQVYFDEHRYITGRKLALSQTTSNQSP